MTSRRINGTAVFDVLRTGMHIAREIATKLDTPAAAPRLAPNLQPTLAGYDREIRGWVELCMLARIR
ncbi:putative phage DNA-binding protein [Burkholderia pseudomallei]|uniref:hypothetical protein n=1 Tax=Burkholderia pseudomallei TaxID=28450 RepID=UPI000F0858BE|nr:hypothetical protein [Burkholderia pseudomallei]CAJ2900108.1 putative phage DNA-binding protein [Burkholderia pseudomallei]VCG48340.1 putative phage DNA-binding protein [Burkholderia pseudomallei]VCG67546.1 putative phage DNA-binding protein [Burkholderia pseudomallei]VCG69802.1 putative phage DNA-binding protein [Burkholderia pseudomallei]VCG73354.1 putative phage DNA-binding protein [Burkholderia pseudomallei]